MLAACRRTAFCFRCATNVVATRRGLHTCKMDTPPSSKPSLVRGVVFDLDGCLTRPGSIDFKEMRRRACIPPDADILGHIAGLSSDDERQQSTEAVLEVEAEGLARMELRTHLYELFDFLHKAKVKRALLTRNTHHALEKFVSLSGLTFDDMLDRSFEPPKPHPAPLLEICKRWQLSPSEVVMVGDHSDDVECGNRAGCTTIQIVADVPQADRIPGKKLATPVFMEECLLGVLDKLQRLVCGTAKL